MKDTLTYGWNSSRTWRTGTWGYEAVVYADLGASYSFPLFDEDPFLVQKAITDVYLGTLNQLNILTPYLKINLYLDVWGMKYTFLNAVAKYNTVDYSVCTMANWMLEAAKGEVYATVSVNECVWGLVSYLDSTENAVLCEWNEYAI